MSYITVDNLNIINAEMTNWCNASCPRCGRFTWNELKLRKEDSGTFEYSNEHISLRNVNFFVEYAISDGFNDINKNPNDYRIFLSRLIIVE